ncbi:MAG: hypothetical protein AAF483_05550 [Planctomycetota bacterium]
MLKRRTGLLVLALLVAFSSSLVGQEPKNDSIPLTSTEASSYSVKPMTMAQQRAHFEAQQRMLRMEFNKWIGYSPLRPTMNSSYMSNGVQRYYIPSRGIIVSNYNTYSWYW